MKGEHYALKVLRKSHLSKYNQIDHVKLEH